MDSSSCFLPPSREWPVRNLTLVASPRCVSGTPMSAQMPDAAVIPKSAQRTTLSNICYPRVLFPCNRSRQFLQTRNSKTARPGQDSSGTWYAVDFDAALLQVQHLLAAAAKDVGVAALEPQHLYQTVTCLLLIRPQCRTLSASELQSAAERQHLDAGIWHPCM